MATDETELERGQRITQELIGTLLARPDMGAQEMINTAAGVLRRYDQDQLVTICSFMMRYAAEQTWDLQTAVSPHGR